MRKTCFAPEIALSCLLLAAAVAGGADWPQWRGSNRDGKSPETGLLRSWPDGGPKRLWIAQENLGKGFASVAVARGTIYTTGMIGKTGYAFALNLDGTLKWKCPYGPEWTRNFPSARSTPTVDGDRVYLMSAMGKVICLRADNGRQVWSVDTVAKYGNQALRHGRAESVLIHGDKAICTPGGPKITLVALDKTTGKEVWKTGGLGKKAAYCSPILVRHSGKDLLVTVTSHYIVGVQPQDGRELWKHPFRGKYGIHPNSPLYKDGRIYVSAGYDAGSVMLALSADGKRVKQLWKDQTLDVHHGGLVEVDGHIYGANWLSNSKGKWACLEWTSSKVRYETKWKNKGSIIYADGMLYCYEEGGGAVALVKATPKGFHVVSSFQVQHGSGKHWAHPAISDGRLYIRHGEKLAVYGIKGK